MRSIVFESPVTNGTDTLEVRRVSIIKTKYGKKPYLSVSDVAVRVEHSQHAKITNVIGDIAKIVTRTKKKVTCAT